MKNKKFMKHAVKLNSAGKIKTRNLVIFAVVVAIAGTAYVLMSSASTGAAAAVPFYRLRHLASGEHFYTANKAERDVAIKKYGYVSEGIEGRIYTDKIADAVPLYRMRHMYSGEHFYTTDAKERAIAMDRYGYLNEGVAGYVFPLFSNTVNSAPKSRYPALFRSRHLASGEHFYTTNLQEANDARRKYGYVNENTTGFLLINETQSD